MRPYLIAVVIAAVLLGGFSIYLNVSNRANGKEVRLQPDDTKFVALGEKIYAKNCASCHGRDLKGQPTWRQRDSSGYLPAPPHDDSGHTWHHADRLLFNITKFGTAKVIGQNYKTRMPGYQEILTDDEIIAVLSFIKAQWPKAIRRRHDRINDAARRN